MADLVLKGSTSGETILRGPAVGTGTVITVPTETGTLRTTVSTGTVLQVVSSSTGAFATGTTQIPIDNTIPQNTEGTEFMTLAITPRSATSKLKIEVIMQTSNSVASWCIVALFQDSIANALATGWGYIDTATAGDCVTIVHYMTSPGTGTYTFKVRGGPAAASTFGINGQAGVAARYGGTLASSITITEVVP